jgi:hypothetical protein
MCFHLALVFIIIFHRNVLVKRFCHIMHETTYFLNHHFESFDYLFIIEFVMVSLETKMTNRSLLLCRIINNDKSENNHLHSTNSFYK